MTIKTRITLIVFALTTLVVMAQWVANTLTQSVAEQRYEQLAIDAKSVLWKKISNSVLDRMQAASKTLMRDRAVIKALRDKNYSALEEDGNPTFNRLSAGKIISGLKISDLSGTVRFAAPEGTIGQTRQGLILKVLEEKKIERGIEYNGEGHLVAEVAFPLYFRGQLVGVAAYEYELNAAIADFKANDNSEVFIITPENQLIYSTNQGLFDKLKLGNQADTGVPQGFHVVQHDKRYFSVVVTPIRSATGQQLASLISAKDDTSSIAHEAQIQRMSLMSIVAVLIINAILLFWFLRFSFKPIERVIHTIEQFSRGKLVEEGLSSQFKKDEAGRLLKAVGEMNSSLRRIVSSVLSSSDNIASASAEIEEASTALAVRTEEQSVNVVETSGNMNSITTTVKQNANSADEAAHIARQSLSRAQSGVDSIHHSILAVKEIEESSQKIVNIIAVIDEIAFQTNLLALNASVEAARAGEQGKGFSVVANEVRNLAQRSSVAANEIKELIGSSVDKVGRGTQLVSESGQILDEIVQSVDHVASIVGNIAAASREQAMGIDEINTALAGIDEATQKNTAMVEESAVSAQVLADEARMLREHMAFFKLDNDARATVVRTVSRKASRPLSQPLDSSNVSSLKPHRHAEKMGSDNVNTAYAKTGTDDQWESF